MAKITASDIRDDLGFTPEMFARKESIVIGDDGLTYRCILNHVASAANKPVTGVNYATYWVQETLDNAVDWVDATTYAADFTTFLDNIITKQAALFAGRIGASAYASTTSPTKEYVERAELLAVAIELLKIRRNILLGNAIASGTDPDTTSIDTQIKEYREELNGSKDITGLVSIIGAGSPTDTGSDFASGALVTDHFGETQ